MSLSHAHVYPGLEVSKSAVGLNDAKQDIDTYILSTQMNDSERFKHAEKPSLRCSYCKQLFVYEGIVRKIPSSSHQNTSVCGLVCPNSSCSRVPSSFSIISQLTCMARDFIQKYYDAYLECDEPSCRYRTRKIPLTMAPYCSMMGCQGVLHIEASIVVMGSIYRYDIRSITFASIQFHSFNPFLVF
jgi:DNA polymerase alpha subunit A